MRLTPKEKGILMPSDLTEPPPLKKRKMEPETVHPKGNSSTEGPSTLIAIAEPVKTIGTSKTIVPEMALAKMELTKILGHYTQVNQRLEKWITQTAAEKKVTSTGSCIPSKSQAQVKLLQEHNTTLENQMEIWQKQLKTTKEEIQKLNSALEPKRKTHMRNCSPIANRYFSRLGS